MSATTGHQARQARVARQERARNWSLTARAFNAVGWSYLASVVFLLAQVAYTALTARLVGPFAFGGYALALTIVQLAGLFGAGGLGNAVMRTPELDDRGAHTALTLAAASGFLVTLVLVAVSEPIQHWFRTPGTAQALQILAAQPAMLAVAGVSYGLLRRAQRYRAASLIDLAACLAGFAVGAVATGLGMGAAGLSLGQAVRGLAAMVVALLCARISLRPAYDGTQARDFMSFSMQVTGQNLGHAGIAYLPLWSIARLAGGAATGLFSRAYQIVALPADQFSAGLMRALYPLYREVNTDKDRVGRALTEGLVLTSGACAIVFGTFAALVQPMAIILLGPRWHAAAAVAPLLCVSAAFSTQYAVLTSAAEALRWMRLIWVTQLVFLVAMGAFLFVASGHLLATAVAMAAATIVSHGFMLAWVFKQRELHVREVARAYSVHAALGVILALVPPLISRITVGGEPIPALCVRMATLVPLGFTLWLFRNRVPGLKLGLMRWRLTRPRHVPRHHVGAPAAESFRRLCVQLAPLTAASGARRLAVTSMVPGAPGPAVAANIALALAEGGATVALVDVDPASDLAQYFGADGPVDVAAVIDGVTPLHAAVQRYSERLLYLPVGTAPPSQRHVVVSPTQLTELVALLRQQAHQVVVHVGPVLANARCAELCAVAETVVLTTQKGKDRQAELRLAAEILRSANARLGAVVLANRRLSPMTSAFQVAGPVSEELPRALANGTGHVTLRRMAPFEDPPTEVVRDQ